jgi:hypothetical protein
MSLVLERLSRYVVYNVKNVLHNMYESLNE